MLLRRESGVWIAYNSSRTGNALRLRNAIFRCKKHYPWWISCVRNQWIRHSIPGARSLHLEWRYLLSYQAEYHGDKYGSIQRRNTVVQRMLLSTGRKDMEPQEKAVETHRLDSARIPMLDVLSPSPVSHQKKIASLVSLLSSTSSTSTSLMSWSVAFRLKSCCMRLWQPAVLHLLLTASSE